MKLCPMIVRADQDHCRYTVSKHQESKQYGVLLSRRLPVGGEREEMGRSWGWVEGGKDWVQVGEI